MTGEGLQTIERFSPLTHHSLLSYRAALSLKGRGHNNERRDALLPPRGEIEARHDRKMIREIHLQRLEQRLPFRRRQRVEVVARMEP